MCKTVKNLPDVKICDICGSVCLGIIIDHHMCSEKLLET